MGQSAPASKTQRVIVAQHEGHPSVRVRDSPEDGSRVLGEIPSNSEAELSIEESKAARSFCKVKWRGIEGWIGVKNIRESLPGGCCTTQPVTVVQRDGHPSVRVFESPDDIDARVVGEIPSDSEADLFVIESMASKSFARVKWRDVEGWIGIRNLIQDKAGTGPSDRPSTLEEGEGDQTKPVIIAQKEGYPSVRVFEHPEPGATVVGEIPSESEAVIFVNDAYIQKSFYRVRWRTIEGWVGLKNVRQKPDVSDEAPRGPIKNLDAHPLGPATAQSRTSFTESSPEEIPDDTHEPVPWGERPKHRTSFTESSPEEIPRMQDGPIEKAKSVKGRQATGFIFRNDVPSVGDEEEEAEDPASSSAAPAPTGSGLIRLSPTPESSGSRSVVVEPVPPPASATPKPEDFGAQSMEGLSGMWTYTDGRYKFRLSRVKDTHPPKFQFKEKHADGRQVEAMLTQEGDWYQGSVTEKGQTWGTVRFRLSSTDMVISNFQRADLDAWGEDVVCTADGLEGMWSYREGACKYRLNALLGHPPVYWFEEIQFDGKKVKAKLEKVDDKWYQGHVMQGSERAGLVRLCLWEGDAITRFRKEDGQWSEPVVATRISRSEHF